MLGARPLVQPGADRVVQLGVGERRPLAAQSLALQLNAQLVQLERDAKTCGGVAIHRAGIVVGACDRFRGGARRALLAAMTELLA